MRKFVLAIMLLALGCGGGGPSDQPDLGQVKGVVTVDGSPKAGLKVSFQPEDGRTATGTTNEAGEYTLQYTVKEKGTKIGKNLVTITSPTSSDEGCGGSEGIFLDPIHPKYNTDAANNPEMTVEVKAGENTFDFKVTTDTKARTKSGGSRSNTCE